MLRTASIVLTVAISCPAAWTQMRSAGRRGPSPSGVVSIGFYSTASFHHGFFPRFGWGLYDSPFLWGAPYDYADAAQATPSETPARYVIEQPAGPASASARTPTGPLMIEWQNGEYVRVADRQEHEKPLNRQAELPRVTRREPVASAKPGPSLPSAAPALPPVVLIFRDGHREQVRQYTIADGALYAQGLPWAEGYWNRKIPLSQINLGATESVNQKNGVDFVLPTSANEVVTRP